MRNKVRAFNLTAEVTKELTSIIECMRQNKVTSANTVKEIGRAGAQRLEDLRNHLANGLDGVAKADVMMVSDVDTLHVGKLVRLAREILLPEADSLSLCLCEKKESGCPVLFLANVREFVPFDPEKNKYLIIESNKLGSDVRSMFADSVLLLIK